MAVSFRSCSGRTETVYLAHSPRCFRLRAKLPDRELFSHLRRDFGVSGDSAEVGTGSAGRGLFFVKDSEPDTTIRIPIHNTLLITDDPTGGSSIAGERHLRRFQDIHGDLPELLRSFLLGGEARWEVRMCAWLLWLMKSSSRIESPPNPHSPWGTYISALPSLDNLSLLLSYSPVEQRFLTIPRYIRESESQRDIAEIYHYKYFYGLRSELGSLQLSSNASQTIWGLSLARSRSFGVTIGCEDVTIMSPFLDIANHSAASNSSFRATEDGEHLELYTLASCKCGDELLISYGADKSNFEIMRDYGFVLEGSAEFADRIHFVYECQNLLRDQGAGAKVRPDACHAGGVHVEAEAAAKLIWQTRPCFRSEVTDASPNKRFQDMTTLQGLSFDLLSATLQKYTSAEHGASSYEKAAVRSLEPLMSHANEDASTLVGFKSFDLVHAVARICSDQAKSAASDMLFGLQGDLVDCSKQAELATGLQQLCSALLIAQRERKAVHLPDLDNVISPRRRQAADQAYHEHLRVLVAIHRVLEMYKQALRKRDTIPEHSS